MADSNYSRRHKFRVIFDYMNPIDGKISHIEERASKIKLCSNDTMTISYGSNKFKKKYNMYQISGIMNLEIDIVRRGQ